jgi:hypothetical protein
MLVTARPSVSPGAIAVAAAPISVLVFSWVLVAGLCGIEEFSRIVGSAGSFAPLVVLSGLVELTFLTVMVCHICTGRVVPLAVMLGMATLPWTVGLLGSEVIVGRALATLGELEASEAHNALALGAAEAMASRMVGACTSAALLLGLGLALTIARSREETSRLFSDSGYASSLLLGTLVAVALAATALLGAMEAHGLFERLTRLVQAPISTRASLLGDAAETMERLKMARQTFMALLAALGLMLLVWKLRRGVQQVIGWMGSTFLFAAIAALLVLDSHPLGIASERARAAGLGPTSRPTGFEALHMSQHSAPQSHAALATPDGLLPPQGAPFAWSTSAKALGHTLASSLRRSRTDAVNSIGVTPEPTLPLLADARLSGSAVRRLIEAGTYAGARSVDLLGEHPDAASPATLDRLQARAPFLALLAARSGTQRLLLPSALAGPVTVSWRARFEGEATLRLSPVNGGSPLVVSLHATPAEVPEELAGTLVGLELSDTVSLRQLGAAAQVLELAGATPVVMLDTPSRVALPAGGGTHILELSPAPIPLPPELLQRMVEAQRSAVQVLRQLEASRSAPEAYGT